MFSLTYNPTPAPQHGQTSDPRTRDQGSRPYRLPGPVYPGQGGVPRGAEQIHHSQREGPRAGRRHPHPPRVGERSQEAEIIMTGFGPILCAVIITMCADVQ